MKFGTGYYLDKTNSFIFSSIYVDTNLGIKRFGSFTSGDYVKKVI